jgi:hypothetical protein
MRSEESCCTGSGLRGLKGVNLEVCLESRNTVRMTERGFGVGGIMYLVCRIRKIRNLLLQGRKYKLELDIQKFARRRNPYKIR